MSHALHGNAPLKQKHSPNVGHTDVPTTPTTRHTPIKLVVHSAGEGWEMSHERCGGKTRVFLCPSVYVVCVARVSCRHESCWEQILPAFLRLRTPLGVFFAVMLGGTSGIGTALYDDASSSSGDGDVGYFEPDRRGSALPGAGVRASVLPTPLPEGLDHALDSLLALLHCSHCTRVLSDPHSLSCGHSFCRYVVWGCAHVHRHIDR